VAASAVSNGSSTAICFPAIPAGTYVVSQQPPRNVEMTTAQNATVDVTNGSAISLEFGSRPMTDDAGSGGEEATPDPDNGQTPDDGSGNGPSTLALIGLGAILVAVVLLVVLIVVLIRQSSAPREG
jgi:hypothetical protein